MRKAYFIVGLIVGILPGAILVPMMRERSVHALPPKPGVPGPCGCGCATTGECLCPSCSVGCGFLPAPGKK